MAKIIPSALITAIHGKWNGSCFQIWKENITLRRNPRPRAIFSASRYNYKGTVASLSGCFYSMSPLQRAAWRSYAKLLPSNLTGFNAFMSRGAALDIACHSDLCTYFDAPSSFSPPMPPSIAPLCFYPSTSLYCLSWSDPNCASVYIQGMSSVQSMYSNKKDPKWSIFNTVPSTNLHMIFDASRFPSNQIISFATRSINTRGETSVKSVFSRLSKTTEDITIISPS